MREYVVGLKKDVDYDAFWHEIETDGSGSTFVPDRSVDIVNPRAVTKRICHYELSDDEAAKLRNDPRVQCVTIPVTDRTDVVPVSHSINKEQQWSKQAPMGWPFYYVNGAGINWGLARINSATDNLYPNTIGFLDYPYPLDGTGVDFVVQDSGCYWQHPEFRSYTGQQRINKINWYTASGIPGTQPPDNLFYTDTYGHGTHVASTVIGAMYGRGKNAALYSMQVEGLGGYSSQGIPSPDCFDCITGWHNNKPIDPATGYKRPTVVNMSWGYQYFWPGQIHGGIYRGTPWTGTDPVIAYGMTFYDWYIPARVDDVDIAVEEMIDAGIIVVGSAGNSYMACDVPGGVDYDNLYWDSDSNPVYYMRGSSPPAAPGVINVGAVDAYYDYAPLEQKVDFSNSGPRVDVYAPGVNIYAAMSLTNQFSSDIVGWYEYYSWNSGNYRMAVLQGTSMASPNVAGIAVQLAQLYPSATPAQIRQMIINNARTGMLYDTVATDDWADLNSLHGSANTYAYQPWTASIVGSITGVTGDLYVTNISVDSKTY